MQKTTITLDEYKKLNRSQNIGSKYNSIKTYIDGIKFDSKKESEYYLILKQRKNINDIKDFFCQVKFDLKSNNLKVGTYTIDFKIIHNDDTVEYVEVKGMGKKGLTTWVLKWNILRSMFADKIDISFTIAGEIEMIEYIKNMRSIIKPENWFTY